MVTSNPPGSFLTSPSETQLLYENALKLFGEGRHPDAVPLLARAAYEGHVEAMTLLGGQLLSGRGIAPDPAAGIRLIMDAASRGGGYACALAAALFASGLSGQADWPRALDWLQRSAEAGFARAQAQLQLLAQGAGGKASGGETNWRELRRSVSLEAWRKAPKPRVLNEDPSLRVFDAIISPAVCDWLIVRGRERLAPAQVYDAVTGGPKADASRRNSAGELALVDMDLVILAVRERLAAAAGLPVSGMQGPQVLHYAVGERFTPHFDFLDPTFEGHARDLAARGQRIATALIYLNDDLEGGETDFPDIGVRYRGGRGDALVFANVDAAGQPDRRTLHAGLPPTKGEKWLFSQWIRDRAPPGVGDPSLVAALTGA